MKAITLYRPWPYAIAHLGKNIENRTWKCPLPLGTPIAIHAGKKWDEEGANFIRRLGFTIPEKEEHPTGVISVVTFQGNFNQHSSQWFTGPIGWMVPVLFVLPNPIPAQGKERLWTLDTSTLVSVTIAMQNG